MIYSFFNLQPYTPPITGMGVLEDVVNAATTNVLVLKLIVMFILFAILLKGTERLFPDNHGTSVIISLLISILGVIFIPDAYILALMTGFSALGVVLVGGLIIVIPWLLIDLIPGVRESRLRFVLYGIFYLGMAWLFSKLSNFDVINNLGSPADSVVEFLSTTGVWILAALGILYLLWWIISLLRGRHGEGGGHGGGYNYPEDDEPDEPRRPRGPGFWRTLGRNVAGYGRGVGQRLNQRINDSIQRYNERRARIRELAEQRRRRINDNYGRLIGRALQENRPGLARRLEARRDRELGILDRDTYQQQLRLNQSEQSEKARLQQEARRNTQNQQQEEQREEQRQSQQGTPRKISEGESKETRAMEQQLKQRAKDLWNEINRYVDRQTKIRNGFRNINTPATKSFLGVIDDNCKKWRRRWEDLLKKAAMRIKQKDYNNANNIMNGIAEEIRIANQKLAEEIRMFREQADAETRRNSEELNGIIKGLYQEIYKYNNIIISQIYDLKDTQPRDYNLFLNKMNNKIREWKVFLKKAEIRVKQENYNEAERIIGGIQQGIRMSHQQMAEEISKAKQQQQKLLGQGNRITDSRRLLAQSTESGRKIESELEQRIANIRRLMFQYNSLILRRFNALNSDENYEAAEELRKFGLAKIKNFNQILTEAGERMSKKDYNSADKFISYVEQKLRKEGIH